MTDQLILNSEKIERIVERLSYQVAESTFGTSEIRLIGIVNNGYILTQMIAEYLQKIDSTKVVKTYQINVDKKNLKSSTFTFIPEINPNDSSPIILIDDVINSGMTLFYSLKPFLELSISSLQTLVLVERKHKKYPISSDFVGISLNTTYNNHIEVKQENSRLTSAYLL